LKFGASISHFRPNFTQGSFRPLKVLYLLISPSVKNYSFFFFFLVFLQCLNLEIIQSFAQYM
jgi:hypothetical protein